MSELVKESTEEYWLCIIGSTDRRVLQMGADAPLRNAVRRAFEDTTGHADDECYSGWGVTEERKNVLMAIRDMEEDDPLYITVLAMLKGTNRL